MRATLLAGVLMVAAVSGMSGQAKDSAIDLADVSDKPAMLTHPDLGYKDCYKDAGLTGTDVVKFVVDTAGHVDPTSVGLTQVTHPILDSLAVRVVRGIVFKPGAMAGAKVRVSVGLPVRFGNGQPPVNPDAVVFKESCVDKKAQPIQGKTPVESGTPVATVPADSYSSPGAPRIPRPGMGPQVQVRVEVDALGQVADATVADAAAPSDLAQRAVITARRMQFQPARIDGNFVASWVTIRVPVAM